MIAVSGRGELWLKSLGILLAALWLIVDLWFRLLPTTKQWKVLLGWTGTNVLLILVMVAMYWWLDGKLKDQLDDVMSKLAVNAYSEPNSIESMFSVTNGGQTDIGYHDVYCIVNFEGFSEHAAVTGGRDRYQMVKSDTPLRAGGGMVTSPCISGFEGNPPLLCADITVVVEYALITQPTELQKKRQRFYGRYNGQGLKWYGEPVDTPGDFCGGPRAWLGEKVWQEMLSRRHPQ